MLEGPAGRLALCHDWLTTFGGADQVAARLARTLSIADVYAYAVWPETAAALFPSSEVEEIGPRWAPIRKHWQWLLPQMHRAWTRLDLSAYDAVITSAHSFVNSVRPRPDALLISYCHTPMRYAWEWRTESRRLPALLRPFWPVAAAALRRSDKRSAQRVDLFIANSRFVAGRVRRSYGKGALVVYPPIATDYWKPAPDADRDEYFLLSGRMVAYKRPEVVVQAAKRAGVELIVAGSGPMMSSLRGMASAQIRFEAEPTRERLRELYRRARAFVFAGVEDFGMSIVEAQACGTPVIAFKAGGALETVVPGVTGELVPTSDPKTFAEVMRTFDAGNYDRATIRKASLTFDVGRFDRSIEWAVTHALSRDWATITHDPRWMDGDGDLGRMTSTEHITFKQ